MGTGLSRPGGAAGTDAARAAGFIVLVQLPQVGRERGRIFRRQRQEVVDEGVGAILVEEGDEIVRQRFAALCQSSGRRQEFFARECKIVRQGRAPVVRKNFRKSTPDSWTDSCDRVLNPRDMRGQGPRYALNFAALR